MHLTLRFAFLGPLRCASRRSPACDGGRSHLSPAAPARAGCVAALERADLSRRALRRRHRRQRLAGRHDRRASPRLAADVAARGLRHLVETQRGPAAARNAGWRTTDAELIAFIDDDCVPEPEWLEAGVAAMRADDRLGVVQGCTRKPGGLTRRRLDALTRQIAGPTPFFEGLQHLLPAGRARADRRLRRGASATTARTPRSAGRSSTRAGAGATPTTRWSTTTPRSGASGTTSGPGCASATSRCSPSGTRSSAARRSGARGRFRWENAAFTPRRRRTWRVAPWRRSALLLDPSLPALPAHPVPATVAPEPAALAGRARRSRRGTVRRNADRERTLPSGHPVTSPGAERPGTSSVRFLAGRWN